MHTCDAKFMYAINHIVNYEWLLLCPCLSLWLSVSLSLCLSVFLCLSVAILITCCWDSKILRSICLRVALLLHVRAIELHDLTRSFISWVARGESLREWEHVQDPHRPSCNRRFTDHRLGLWVCRNFGGLRQAKRTWYIHNNNNNDNHSSSSSSNNNMCYIYIYIYMYV